MRTLFPYTTLFRSLDEPVKTDTIRIGILGDYPGLKYYDTAISEIEVYGIN